MTEELAGERRTIHDTAARGFERAGAEYERGRPGYPAQAVSWLARELQIRPGRTVADVGAGTGKLTRDLVPLGARVIAIEPIAGMREQLLHAVPDLEVLDGVAEALPLPDDSLDAITVAQAMHWFDIPHAASEFDRVLKRRGGLGILSNGWDLRVPWVSRMQEVVHSYAGDTPRHDTSPWRDQLAATGLFTGLEERVLPNVIPADVTTLLFRVSSVSYISSLETEERAHVLRKVHDIATREAQKHGGRLALPYRCNLWWCHAT
jgi:SAM-dependent methyltransferase